MKNRLLIILLVMVMILIMVISISTVRAGVYDGTGPLGDQEPDRIHWICTAIDTDNDGSVDSTMCCPPGFGGNGNCCKILP